MTRPTGWPVGRRPPIGSWAAGMKVGIAMEGEGCIPADMAAAAALCMYTNCCWDGVETRPWGVGIN